MEFASFLLESLDNNDMKNVKDIILFGSVSRGVAERDSDVDIFVNTLKESGIEGKIDKIKNDFYATEMFRRWKLKGVENEIKIMSGRLDKLKDLKISIIDDGISLYSKYTARSEGSQQVIIFWDNVKPESKRVLLSKKLYGYNYKKTRYRGIVELTNSTKLATNCIISDLGDSKKILEVFKELGITAKTIYVERI